MAITNYTFGDNVTGAFDDTTGVLTINGTGDMYDFQIIDQPISSVASSILNVIVQEGITKIGDYTFYYCSNLNTVSLPNALTQIGEHAFQKCAFTSITIPGSVTSIGSWAFFMCEQLLSINLPNIEIVEEYTFSNCTSLSSVTIPETVKNIGIGAFEYTALTTVNLPSQLETLGIDSFKQSKLTSIVIPNLIQAIPHGAFGYCYDLASITIPSGVTSIGIETFIFCWKLSEIINTSKINQTIGNDAFYDTGSDVTPRIAYAYSTNTNFITEAQTAGYDIVLLQSGLDIYVITYNETTQQNELRQVESISLIAGTNEVKELKNVSEFKIITDTGLK